MKKILQIFVLALMLSAQAVYAEQAVGDEAYDAYEKATYYYEKKDYKNELKWLKISFETEETKEIAFNIGLSYKNLKDYDNAIKWYKKAFKMGNIDGGVNLGFLYEIVLHDHTNAIKWYKKCVALKDYDSIKNLGNLYHKEGKKVKGVAYMLGLLSIKPEKKDKLIKYLKSEWELSDNELKEAYKLQLTLIPNPYRDSEFEDQPIQKKSGRR